MKLRIIPSVMSFFILFLGVDAATAQLRVLGGNSISFGKIYQTGAKVHKIIKLENTGKSEIRIETVHTSCGCTAAIVSDSTVPPGKRTELKVQFDPTGYIGDVTKYVYIISTDTSNRMIAVRLSGYVAYALQPTPSYIVINAAVISKLDSTSITLSNTSDKTFEITKVAGEVRGLSFKLDKNTLKPGEYTDLTIYIMPQTAGDISGFVHVYTTSKLQPELQLRLVASVIGR